MGVCNRVISIILAVTTVGTVFGVSEVSARQSSKASVKTERQTTKNKNTKTQKSTKATTKKRQVRKSGTQSGKKAPESKAELQRRQQAAQAEIAETRRKIQENDRQVRQNLAELGKLQGDIETTKKQVAATRNQVTTLQNRIGTLEGKIAQGDKEVARMRGEYLKAVKAVRKRKGSNSTLAYIFSSKSFGEARRRMRYLREFSEWRKKQTDEIQKELNVLNQERTALAHSRDMYGKALARNVTAQKQLETQYGKQDAIVVQLRANGSALKTHLAQKQQEANALKGRVAALIAAEQRAAEQREAERLAAEKRAAEQRAAEQRAAEEKAARDRELAMTPKPGKTEEAKEPAKPKQTQKDSKTKEQRKRRPKQPKQDKQQPKQEKTEPQKNASNSGREYADARNRRPRSDRADASVSSGTSSASASGSKPAGGSNFASMRGSLPRPVGGAFNITSRFGPHSLPDLPDVVYDNPGIDAEVSRGATAQAVYAGKVSGVYMIPGFSTVVIVNHGGYYTVYGNLASASVKVGDVVKQGSAVGRVADSEDSPGHGQIHFEVWKNRDKQDPLAWIR